MRIGRLFDGTDDAGRPEFSARLIMECDAERARVLGFLKGGRLVLRTSARGPDLLAPERKRGVPMSFATDGTWIWSRAAAYYLAEHGIAPEDDLLEHIHHCRFHADVPDQGATDRAVLALQQHFASVHKR
ncbi:hypothetical protein ACFXNW_27020 [Nocardia sp. NPDC059180]|uniref:hypothetical protein n=1 Tax=Nocardia sp. NPDC059180 TaxID=3346761 RepID=UPI003697AF14